MHSCERCYLGESCVSGFQDWWEIEKMRDWCERGVWENIPMTLVK